MDDDTQASEPGEQAAPAALTDEQRMAAFEAGLAGKTTATPIEPDQNADEQQAEPKAEDPPRYVQITETELAELRSRFARIDEIEQTVKRDRDAIYGSIGGLKQSVNARQTIKLADKAKLDALRAELPEVAELFDAIEVAAAPPVVDRDEMAKLVDERATQLVEQERQRAWAKHCEDSADLLSERHPDWQQVGASKELTDFVKAKGDDYGRRFERANQSWDWQRLDRVMSEFKAAKKKSTDEAAARRERMQQNIDPRAGAALSAPPPTREDAFTAGLRKVGIGR